MRWDANTEIIWEIGDWITFHDVSCSDIWLFRVDSIDGISLGSVECYFAKKDTSGGMQPTHWEKYPNNHSFVFFHKSIHDFTPAGFKDIRECKKLEKIMLGNYEVKFGSDIKFANDTTENLSKEIIQVGSQIVSKDTFLKIGKKAGWITE